MIDKIKKIIDQMKKDNESYKKYITSFCESPKAKELFEENDDFKYLKEETPKISDKKEDEYF